MTDTDNDEGWCELPRLIVSRNKLRTELRSMRDFETQAFTVEQEICGNRVGEEQSLCGSCGHVKEPRQRKIAALRLMHRAILTSKPKPLLCTAGIITRMESMILAGYLDSGSTNKVTRCRHCRQDTNKDALKGYLVSEFIDILEEQRSKCTNKENCSMTEACCACLDFMLSQLKNPELFKIQNTELEDQATLNQEVTNVPTKAKKIVIQDYELDSLIDDATKLFKKVSPEQFLTNAGKIVIQAACVLDSIIKKATVLFKKFFTKKVLTEAMKVQDRELDSLIKAAANLFIQIFKKQLFKNADVEDCVQDPIIDDAKNIFTKQLITMKAKKVAVQDCEPDSTIDSDTAANLFRNAFNVNMQCLAAQAILTSLERAGVNTEIHGLQNRVPASVPNPRCFANRHHPYAPRH
ncbi:hypothetical protein B566_EDAN015419 [Ephemera danica]|nr:hypothetical protein B566_EDAN015419 [Ephemera danica]